MSVLVNCTALGGACLLPETPVTAGAPVTDAKRLRREQLLIKGSSTGPGLLQCDSGTIQGQI